MDDREMVGEVNAQFYRALEQLSIEEMEEVWLQGAWVKCIHRGRGILVGWEAIWESWLRIFGRMRMVTVDLSEVAVMVEGDLAWVVCRQHLASVTEDGMGGEDSLATNIFCRTEEGWKLVHHHASPLPGVGGSETGGAGGGVDGP